MQKSRPYSEKYSKPLFSISKIPSPAAESFKSKKPSSERDLFATSSENTVDAIDSCGTLLDQNVAVPKRDEDWTVFSSGVSSSTHVMWLCTECGNPSEHKCSLRNSHPSFMAGITTCDIPRIFTATTTYDPSMTGTTTCDPSLYDRDHNL